MSRIPASISGGKRKRPDSEPKALSADDQLIYNVIHARGDMGMIKSFIQRETNLGNPVINKSLNTLTERNMIKLVVNVKSKAKTYMAAEFEPSRELTGGEWYSEGALDTVFVDFLKEQCLKIVKKLKVATLDAVVDLMKSSGMLMVDVSKKQFEEILKALVFDNAVVEVTSTGVGEFREVPVGKVCYKAVAAGKRGGGGEMRLGAMASVPCGVCPRINSCTPDGIISPKTCVYYQKWLDF
ncbi:DNA-directed RNA polymerase III subunit RPC6 [Linum perenne]